MKLANISVTDQFSIQYNIFASLKIFRCALVGLTLEYGFVHWDLNISGDLVIIGRINVKFLRHD